jgi:hypothetical protein
METSCCKAGHLDYTDRPNIVNCRACRAI